VLIHPKNKIIVALLAVAFTIILAFGLLFYPISNKASTATNNNTQVSSEFSSTKVDGATEEKEAPHFSIFSILNKLIPN